MTGNGASASFTSQNTQTVHQHQHHGAHHKQRLKLSHASRMAREAFAVTASCIPPVSPNVLLAMEGDRSFTNQAGASRPALYVASGERYNTSPDGATQDEIIGSHVPELDQELPDGIRVAPLRIDVRQAPQEL